MTTLAEVRDRLLTMDSPADYLRYADVEMVKCKSQGSMYALKAEYAWLKPILDYYLDDLEGWVKFAKNVRDNLPRGSKQFIDVREFHKVLSIRAIQQRTRAILDVAVTLATKRGMIEASYEAKQRYAKRCTQHWRKLREQVLDEARRASPTKRVSVDHREDLLKAFWEDVANDVNNGELPPA